MNILFPVDEAYPIYKIGGLGDVGSALPKALKELGHDVRIILPGHPEIDLSTFSNSVEFSVTYDNQSHPIKIMKSVLPGTDIPVYLTVEPNFISKPSDASDNDIDKFALYSLAVLSWVADYSDWKPDVFHLNDWHTGLIPYVAAKKYPERDYKFLLTIHNLAYQGRSTFPLNKKLDFKTNDSRDVTNLMATGIEYSHFVVPVSENYANEILTPEYAEGLDTVVKTAEGKIHGILNGLDLEVFNPSIDPHIEHHYDATSFREAKSKNKTLLQNELGLEVSQDIPLIGYVGRIDPQQKGIQLIIEAVKQKALPPVKHQFVFLGAGDTVLGRQLTAACSSNKDISLHITYDERLAARIYAASDLMVIPSKFEPCGLVQLIAMRYGALPIARSTGGLTDTINHQRDGFLFNDYSTDAFILSISSAIEYLKDHRKKNSMIKNAMSRDFSWISSAKKYIMLYNQLINKE